MTNENDYDTFALNMACYLCREETHQIPNLILPAKIIWCCQWRAEREIFEHSKLRMIPFNVHWTESFLLYSPLCPSFNLKQVPYKSFCCHVFKMLFPPTLFCIQKNIHTYSQFMVAVVQSCWFESIPIKGKGKLKERN